MEFPGEKLVIKLWETLAEKGIGSLLSPWQAGREGRVRNQIRRDEILMLAQAEIDASDIRSGKKMLCSDGTLLLTSTANNALRVDRRIEPTFAFSTALEYGNRTAVAAAARSEINSAKAILYAEEQLSSEAEPPPEQSVDDDWLFAWREYAGKVSAEDLQRLWGSVLAGEVKTPGKYSIRTLDFLKTLSKADAELISLLAKYVIDGRIARSQDEYLSSHGFSFSMLLQAQDLGVVSGVEALGLTTTYKTIQNGKFFRFLVSHDKVLIVQHEDPSKELRLEMCLLTAVGQQVLGLGSFEPDIEYLRLVGKGFVNQGFTVELADWRSISETRGQYANAQKICGDDPPAEG